MKVHGTKIKIGLSNTSSSSTTNRPEVGGSLAKTRLLASSTPLDTPCPTATIFDLCKTTNDASFHKKRKARTKSKAKDAEGGGGEGTGGGEGGAAGGGGAVASSAADREKTTAARTSSTSTPTTGGSSALGPQVEIVNGKIVLRESSLMVPVHGPVTHEDFEEVEEGIHPTAKYSSFTKHVHSRSWGMEETKQFYESLRQCGTDFSLMQAFFPHRTRKQLKLKFTREEKHHPELIKATLTSQLPLDLAPFEVHLGAILDKGKEKNKGESEALSGVKRKHADSASESSALRREECGEEEVEEGGDAASSTQKDKDKDRERAPDFSASTGGPLVDV